MTRTPHCALFGCQDVDLAPVRQRLTHLSNTFSLYRHPNLLPYQRVRESSSAAFLIRQYFGSNLYDRLRYCAGAATKQTANATCRPNMARRMCASYVAHLLAPPLLPNPSSQHSALLDTH